ncbi:MAG: hypothetical protein J5630_07640 [Bacteroidaceae bacterium]|nr:hypothetical protein [Bacteroidaceae bacterium]
MKKIYFLLAMLMLTVSSAWADVSVTWSKPAAMSYSDFVALAGTGNTFGLQAVSTNTATYKKWFGFTSETSRVSDITTDQLFTLEGTANAAQFKRVSDGLYLSGAGSFGTTAMDVKLVNREAGDHASEFTSAMQISIDNSSSQHYNANSYAFGGGTGGWSTYVAFQIISVESIVFTDESGNTLAALTNLLLPKGALPSIPGYALTNDPTSGQGIQYEYGETYVFEFTKEPYAINFSKDAKFHDNRSGDDRRIEGVGLRIAGSDDQLLETGWVSYTETTNYKDLTSGTKLVARIGKTVTPIWKQKTNAMKGWVYIDLNNDGDFEDDGERVGTSGIWNSVSTSSLSTSNSFEIPNVEPGDYHIRFNVAWSDDPKGYASILADGGSITDAILTIEENPTAVENTYKIILGEEEIASYNYVDDIGEAPAGMMTLPSYVTLVSTDAPETCAETPSTFTYNVQYDNLPFELGTPYSMTIRDDATPQYNIYVDPANEAKVRTIRSTNEKWTTPTLSNCNYFNWVLGGDFYNGFTFKNVATNKYLTYGTNVSPADNTTATIIEEPNAGAKFILSRKNDKNCFKIKDTANNSFINKRGDDLSTWASSSADGETGSAITFCDPIIVTLEDLQAQLAELAGTAKFDLVDGATVVAPSEYDAPIEINEAIDAANEVDNTDAAAIDAFLTSDQAAMIRGFRSASASHGDPLSTVYVAKAGYNTIILPVNWAIPENWTVYSCSAIDGNVLTLAAKTTASKNRPYIIKTDYDETFQFIGYSNGADTENVKNHGILYGANRAASAPANAYVLNGTDRFSKVYEETEMAANNCWIVVESNATELFFEAQPTPETPTANMRITDAGWGTFYATFAVDIPEGVKAYSGEMQNTGWILLTEVPDGIIPANTAVVVAKNVTGEAETWNLPPSELQPDMFIPTCYTGNANNYNITLNDGDYLLQKQGDVIGWYKVEGNGFTLAPNRCYLAKDDVTVPNQSRSFIGFDPVDDATGISSIATEAKTKADGKYMVKGQIVVVKAGKAYNMSGTEIK